MESKHKEEVDKLKRDINGYEARLEAVLEDASRKEKMVDTLLDKLRIVKEINQSLEMQNGSKKEDMPEEQKIPSNKDNPEERKKKKICWYWSRNGRCRFDESCWFEHPEITSSNKEKKEKHKTQPRQRERMNEERKEWLADQNSLNKDSGNRRKDDQSHEREKDSRNTL